ncbi:MAG: helix-turn-helix domain-containing protein [Clostridiales bacterium]|nr:helix-turn-helix domain-containing protein [Clostridiales bacterium]
MMKRQIGSLRDGLQLFKAMSSETRIGILELLMNKGPLSMSVIAQKLKLTGGAITAHVKQLQDAGLVSVEKRSGKHGTLKVCSATVEPFAVDVTAS